MIKYSILILVVFTFSLFAQEKSSPIFVEHNSIINGEKQKEILSFKIPYNNLLFVKTGETYKASFTLTFEFFKDDEFIFREILNPEFDVADYKLTSSNKKYFEDFIEVELNSGEYLLKTIFGLGFTEIEYKIPPRKLNIDDLSSKSLFKPIIINSKKENNGYTLTNFGNLIPFSPQKYSLLIGTSLSAMDTINVSIIQKKKTIFDKKISKSFSGSINFDTDEDNSIILTLDEDGDNNYFLVEGFSHLMYEGVSELIIKSDTLEEKVNLTTKWIGKPQVLNNPEYSIKLLSYVEKDFVIGELLSLSEDEYYANLTDYWREQYPANGMKYNFAMEEYYSRADHAIKNYSSLNSFDGAERDRGKIYILFGEPTSTERNYTEMNEIVEVWTYKNSGRKFIFKDTNGTGKFDIVK